LHDNFGKEDEHLAIGSGNIDFRLLFNYLENNINTPPIVTIEPHEEKYLWPSLDYLAQAWPW
jgi:sugar phosphate isomerase/epimerase